VRMNSVLPAENGPVTTILTVCMFTADAPQDEDKSRA
jgi:hypothetical protein